MLDVPAPYPRSSDFRASAEYGQLVVKVLHTLNRPSLGPSTLGAST